MVGDTATSQRGKQGSTRDAATRERTKDGKRTADSAGSIEGEDRRSENKGHLAERQGDLGTFVETSDNEFDEDGLPFVISSTGTTIFGEIKEETGLTPAPIKLSLGNSKYGLVHLKKRHEKQIRNAGFNSVEEFVEYVCKNYKRIRQGENSVGEENGTYLLQIEDNHNNTLYVELSTDGSYWGVNSGGVFRKEYGNNKKEVWSASEVQNEQSATDSTLRDEDKSDNPTTPNGNVPHTSDSKDTTISPTTNELGEKSAAPSVQEQIQAAEAEVNTNPTEAQKEAGREPQRRQEGAVTDAEIEALNAEILENYRTNSELDKDNERFNNELQQQIDGTLPKGRIYKMGMPGKILLSVGVPNMPIEMSSTRLEEKSKQDNHPFEISELKNLVKKLQSPIAVFKYGNNAKNVIISIDYQGKQFLVGIHFNQNRNGIEVSSIRGIFPKTNAKWLNWIVQGNADYLNKEKIQALIDKQRTNLADVEYLDLDSVAKIVENFENPSVKEENSNREVTEAERKSINPTIIIWYNRTFKSLPITPMLSIPEAQKPPIATNETAKPTRKLTENPSN